MAADTPLLGWRSCTWTVGSRLDWDKAADVLLWDLDIAQQLPPSFCSNLNLGARAAAVCYSPKLLADFMCRTPSMCRTPLTSLRSSFRSGFLFALICLSHLFPVWQSLFTLPYLPVCVLLRMLVNHMVYLHCHSWNLIPHILTAPLDTCTTFCLCCSQEPAECVSCTSFLCIAQLMVPHTITTALWAAKGPSLPLTFLEEIGKKWHVLATGAVSALHAIWLSHCLKAAWFQKWEWKMPSIFRAVARVSSPGILRT